MLKQRPYYLNKLIELKDFEQIKVITGVRRSGKSYLLQLFKDHLLENGVNDDQIVYMNFEDLSFSDIMDAVSLQNFLKEHYTKKQRYYFLFDEIQEVKDWQKLVNSLRVSFDSDIYITGSNASMLSGELATYLTGRFIRIEMQPLSFREYLAFTDTSKENLTFNSKPISDYIQFGGFPSVALVKNDNLKENILYEISENIILRDVAIRGSLSDTEVLRRVVKFLLDNIGQPISTTTIMNTLTSGRIKTSKRTILKILTLLEDAYIFYPCERFDIRGKARLTTTPKYYVVDTGLRNQLLGKFAGNYGGQLENIVYLELIRSGFEVYTGRLDSKEIDFVAVKDGITKYVQVTYTLPNNTHETDNLLAIRDNFQKIVITQDISNVGMIDGIPIIHITDFLLNGLPTY